MQVLVVDNYDSFTFNLVQLLGVLGAEVTVVLHDELDAEAALARPVDAFLLSPGPCTPNEAGICLDLVGLHAARKDPRPLLGVCLGHQAIGQAFGGRVVRAPTPVHGRAHEIRHEGAGLFAGQDPTLSVGRYHSLVVERASLPSELHVDAWTDDGLIMALSHESLPIRGVQFHPESILTPHGADLLRTWLQST